MDRSLGSTLSGWLKSSFGWEKSPRSTAATSCIFSSSPMCPENSGVLAELAGKFLGDSTYSESLSLSPELAAYVMSLLGSAVGLGVAAGPSVGRARFEFVLPLPIAVGVVL